LRSSGAAFAPPSKIAVPRSAPDGVLMPFHPIDSKRFDEQVADRIGDMIRRGEFVLGQRLPAERELAKSLGVSRPVAREAMVALEIAGLLEARAGLGAPMSASRRMGRACSTPGIIRRTS
jgi:DNA-binding transcriptional regulator YhcF (GntR family)